MIESPRLIIVVLVSVLCEDISSSQGLFVNRKPVAIAMTTNLTFALLITRRLQLDQIHGMTLKVSGRDATYIVSEFGNIQILAGTCCIKINDKV